MLTGYKSTSMCVGFCMSSSECMDLFNIIVVVLNATSEQLLTNGKVCSQKNLSLLVSIRLAEPGLLIKKKREHF